MKVVCILAMTHSGSTLLDLMLGGHPRLVGLGEISSFVDPRWGHLNRTESQTCSCERTLAACPFWGPFSRTLLDRGSWTREEAYPLLWEAFRSHFGADRILVDSSKTIETVDAWSRCVGPRHVRVLHVVRDVRGWAHSMRELDRRRGENRTPLAILRRSRLNRFRQWYLGNRRLQDYLAGGEVASLQLGYEPLCLDTERQVERIGRFLDVEPVPEMAAIATSGSHVVLGNRMKSGAGRRAGIVYDDRWKSGGLGSFPAAVLPRVMRYNAREVYGDFMPPL